MKASQGAIAIFVKTPGLSPIKTRLAAGIGKVAAEEFYEKAVESVKAVVQRAARHAGLSPYWAVAEKAGLTDPRWSDFATVEQGEGGLGARLDQVYSTLLDRHSFVLLIGADSPQIESSRYVEAAQLLCAPLESGMPFVLGPAEDGGFYLFGGGQPIPREVWHSVTYSRSTTATELEDRLRGTAVVKRLAVEFDVDTVEDYQRVVFGMELVKVK